MSDTLPKPGDEVTWQWSGNRPGGTVADVKEQAAVAIETHRGNEVRKHGEPGNPAVRIERPGNDVVKKASEIDIEKRAENKDVSKDGGQPEKKENGEASTGEKRKAETPAQGEGAAAKAQATQEKVDGQNGRASPKKKGRPANGEAAPKKETKKREPKKAATESGEPRRSNRVAGKSA